MQDHLVCSSKAWGFVMQFGGVGTGVSYLLSQLTLIYVIFDDPLFQGVFICGRRTPGYDTCNVRRVNVLVILHLKVSMTQSCTEIALAKGGYSIDVQPIP